jgi:menaquinone-dependent protoporphyrinogen IX oxidase
MPCSRQHVNANLRSDAENANVSIHMAKKNAAAMAMVKARLEKTTPEQRAQIAKTAAAARWKGHKAKRPASARRKKATE